MAIVTRVISILKLVVLFLNAVVPYLTLGVLFWYTWETRKMQKVITRQTWLNIMPSFVIEVSVGFKSLDLFNMGNGSGVNIQIKPIDVPFGDKELDDDLNANIKFDRIVFLKPMEKTPVRHVTQIGGKNEDEFYDRLSELEGKALHLTFQDIEGTTYDQLVKVGKGASEPGPVVRRGRAR